MKGKELFEVIGMIDDSLIVEANKEVKTVKHKNLRTIAIIAAAIIAIGAVTTAAGHYIIASREIHGSSIPTYTDVPSDKTLKKDLGFCPVTPEEFSNGYKFTGGHVLSASDDDASGNTVAEFSSFDANYEKDGDSVSIYSDTAETMREGAASENYNGIDIYYRSYMNKFCPPDYEMTEQDKKDEAEGKYVFSFGSSEVYVSKVQGVSFTYDGINYDICAIDSPLEKDELIQMAKELIK